MKVMWGFILLILMGEMGHTQSLYTWAQRARTPAAAKAVIHRSESLPGNVVNTLISAVHSWPKENMQELCKRSAVPIPEKYVLLMAEKFGSLRENGEHIPDPFFLSDLLLWSKNWESPSRNTLQAWLQHHPKKDVDPSLFFKKWTSQGGESFPMEILR